MTRVMGILNVTPDSFSDGGRYVDPGAASERAFAMVDEGAELIDIGAESTRPGFKPVDPDTEWQRLKPVLTRLCRELSVPISVDTYHAQTARRAADMGVDIINDVSAAADPDMARIVRETGSQYVYMHNRSHIEPSLTVDGFVAEVRYGIDRLLESGVQPGQLIVDPGVGFAKTQTQNLACISEIDKFRALGYPVLLGTSRKRVIGNVLDLPVGERLEGSLATAAYAVIQGVEIIRVHDVRATVRLCRMMEAIVHASSA
ncbi:dihydropteroate synthase [Alicyclobacillus hesperidum URH17-3-68]|uniref:dihydropteroate synthase n=1 Tax=Alicyclobacillus hesperidum TaxID=89784 RepID=UPI000281AB10|nr:dihydropteroate synthase [Alicyclobacillus hesperidum]EJY56900.1 dihydropteroate synthase [Alicyclobacillus hesperidum URH17-3-68]